MIGPGSHRRLLVDAGDLHDGDAVVLIVVGEKREPAVGVYDLGAEYRAVPLHELVESRSPAYEMRELLRTHRAARSI